MKTREGVDENKAFGPAPGKDTVWTLSTKRGEIMSSWGESAFAACANVGLSLGQVDWIKPFA